MEWVLFGFAVLVLVAWFVNGYANAFSGRGSLSRNSHLASDQQARDYIAKVQDQAATTCMICGGKGRTMVVLDSQEYYVVCDAPACEQAPELVVLRGHEVARIPVSS